MASGVPEMIHISDDDDSSHTLETAMGLMGSRAKVLSGHNFHDHHKSSGRRNATALDTTRFGKVLTSSPGKSPLDSTPAQQSRRHDLKRPREDDLDALLSLSKRQKRNLRPDASRSSSRSSLSVQRLRASSPPRSQPEEIDLTGDSPRRNAVIDLVSDDDVASDKSGIASTSLASKRKENVQKPSRPGIFAGARKTLEKSSVPSRKDAASDTPQTKAPMQSSSSVLQRIKDAGNMPLPAGDDGGGALGATQSARPKASNTKDLSRQTSKRQAMAGSGMNKMRPVPSDVAATKSQSANAAVNRAKSPGTKTHNARGTQLMQERVDSAHSDGEDSSHSTTHEDANELRPLRNSTVVKILGPRQWDPTVQMILTAQPDIDADRLRNLRFILDKHVDARTDLIALSQRLPKESSVENNETAEDAGKSELAVRNAAQANATRVASKEAEAQVSDEMEQAAAAPAIKAPLPIDSLGLSKQVELVLGRYLEESRGDNEYHNRAQLQRARMSLQHSSRKVHTGLERLKAPEAPYAFTKMQPMRLAHMDKGNARNGRGFGRFLVERTITGPAKAQKMSMTCPTTAFTFPVDMPGYADFVAIKDNFLAPNVTAMQYWPYFGDEFDYTKAEGLSEQYSLDIKDREGKLRRLLQAQKLDEYVANALQDLSITWADVLRFLLEVKPSVGNDEDAKKALSRRDDFCKEEFSRKGERTAMVLSLLSPSTTDQLAKAATLCENFRRMTKFDLWHVARRHLFDNKPEEEVFDPADSLDELTCRMCLRLECPQHGEITEQQDDGCEDPDEGADHAIKTDIVNPLKVNYRTRIAFPPASKKTSEEQDASTVCGKKSLQYWRSESFVQKIDERGPFYGCHHPGSSCSDARCSCFELNLPCEKICTCSPVECSRKFQGCTCKYRNMRKGQHIVCFEDDRCICFNLGRECDADLCGECGVDEVLDPLHRHDDAFCKGKCQNASIQRGVPKHTLIGESGIHGLGLYAGENIKAHDFVGEYKGEIITKDEAERRGAVYEHQKLSYLFVLNATQEIDSTYFGNDIRFINHAHAGSSALNLYPRIFLVNAVHRIALFAEKDIKAGKELLFDYGPKFPDDQLGGKAKAKKYYYEVAETVNKKGQVRATKATNMKAVKGKKVKGAAESTASPCTPGKRGGARPGAGRKPLRKSVSNNAEMEGDMNGAASPTPQSEDHRRPPEDRLAIYYMAENDVEEGMDSNTATTGGLQDEGEDDEEASEFEEMEEDEEDEPSSSPGSGSVASSPEERRGGIRIRGRRMHGVGSGRRHALRP